MGSDAALLDAYVAEEEDGAPPVLYHYTSKEALVGLRQSPLYANSSATDVGTYTPEEASQRLGVPPETTDVVITYTADAKAWVPEDPPVVGPHKWGAGGGRSWRNVLPIEPGNIRSVRWLKPQ